MNEIIENATNRQIGFGLLLISALYTLIGFGAIGIVLTGVPLMTLIPLSLIAMFVFVGSGLIITAAITNLLEN